MMDSEIDLELELHAYVDGDLDEEAMARVETYLSKHPETATKVRDYLQQKDDLRSFARAEASTDEPQALTALAKKLARRLKPSNLFRWRRAMVMTLLFAGGWIGHVVYVPLVEGPPYADDVFRAHLLSSQDPAEILPISPERISKLFARIDEVESLPDLQQFGFEPIGAQLLPSDEGMVLHVPYRNSSGEVISYFLLHDNEVEEVPRHLLHKQNVSIVYWQHNYSRHALAASLADEQLGRIAAFVDSSVGVF